MKERKKERNLLFEIDEKKERILPLQIDIERKKEIYCGERKKKFTVWDRYRWKKERKKEIYCLR